MRKPPRSRRAIALAAATTTLASAGGVAAILVTSGGNSHASALTATYRRTPATPASAAPPRPVLARQPSAPAAEAPGSATPKVTEKPPPVVDGVRRANVRSAHSPQIARQLSGPPRTSPPAAAGGLGVDVADYQHPGGAAINWPLVAAAGYTFAFIKATEGDYYGNPYYAADLAQAKAAGLNVAGYHFAVPNVSGGASQAGYAVRASGYTTNRPTMPLALDIEYNPYGAECYGLSHARMVSWISAFAAEVRRLTGQPPTIYTTADWWNTCTGGSTAFGSDPLWVAGYGSASPPMPAGWANWTFWQFTSQGSVPGITGHVDVSYYLRSAGPLARPGNRRNPVTFKQPSPLRPTSTPSAPSPSHSPTPSPTHSPTPSPTHSPSPSPSPTSPAPSPTSPSPSPTAPSSRPPSPAKSLSPGGSPATISGS
ncbi:MAG TPA: GH25 family lysozyme [Streptosporangiaceae bacterium]